MDLIGSGCSSSPGFTARGEPAFMKPETLSVLRNMVARRSSTRRAFLQHAIHSPALRAPSPLRSFAILAPRHLRSSTRCSSSAAPPRRASSPGKEPCSSQRHIPPGRPPRPDRQHGAPLLEALRLRLHPASSIFAMTDDLIQRPHRGNIAEVSQRALARSTSSSARTSRRRPIKVSAAPDPTASPP
jgi:hypothetical protein